MATTTSTNTAAARLIEENGKFEDLLRLALEIERREAVHRIRMEVIRLANKGQHMDTVYPILDAEDER